MLPTHGRCAICGADGRVGRICPRRRCSIEERCFIPTTDAARYLDGRDPEEMIGRRIADWLVIGHVGSGGIGQVYRVVRLPHGQPEGALKLLRGGVHPDVYAKFAHEAEALARIHDPNVVALFDHGEVEGRPFLVMRYLVDAMDLSGRLARGPVSLDDAFEIVSQCAAGLAAAHGEGVVHRDIKPANIMLQPRASGGLHVALIDFGLAKDLTLDNRTSTVIGTPRYMAPEQVVQGGRIGSWTDWYALTLVAARLLLAEKPFEGLAPTEIMVVKRRPGFHPLGPALDLRGAGPATRAFFERGLTFDVDGRFHTADAFVAALSAAVDETRPETVSAALADEIPPTVDRVLPSFVPEATDSVHPPPRASRLRWLVWSGAVAAAALGAWWLVGGAGG